MSNTDESSPSPAEQEVTVSFWGPPTTKQPKERGARWWHVAIGMALAICLPIIPVAVGGAVFIAQNPNALNDPTQIEAFITEGIMSNGPILIASIICTWLGLLTGVWLAARQTEGGWKTLVSWKFKWKRDLLIALGFTVVLRGIEFGVAALLSLAGVDTDKLGNTGILSSVTGVSLAIILLCTAIGAPIVEEIYFRGLAFGVARKRYGTGIGIVISSLLFGFMHVQGTAASSVYVITSTTIIGVVLAVLVVRTNRLGAAVLSHILFNTSGVILALLYMGG